MQTVISVEKVSKSFGNQQVLKNIDMLLKKGEIIGLIGPSGSGKSTLINIALGVERADSGLTTIFGQKMPNRMLLGKLGYMAQSDALYESLTAKENIRFFAEMKGVDKKLLTPEITRVAKIVSLENYLDKRVSGFSGGMKRRLSLAIALISDPGLLIVDEPTVGSDPALRLQIWQELHRMRDEGHAILVTTHVMDEAELVDRVALLLGGELIANDSPQNLESQYHVDSIEKVFLKAEGELK
ncbi:ABC transporter ATP-binding protein [Leuconostoc gelidum]|uniref:ABC transporter ATP-binding protein n=1 Tax=Leuconostoc gelidum TaxID=1244 RepID=UPI001CC822E6|nr:ABC transporter ATP-binding protein [Leuconostoc gelidum]MBZ5992679.1 ABC transporter ATP-binding protein [Leuconostoc gelidum subsp. gelidum]USP16403.1 ABC transporter ATP-binding protein [Leuconostoc gelidum subsp. aenigmaticum]